MELKPQGIRPHRKQNVLHKLTITNWLPSSNSTSVTHSQATLIYKLFCGIKVDIGQIMFDRIYHESKSKSQSGILPYPSLIYKLLCSQGFVKEREDHLTPVGVFKITSIYVSDDCVVDLPWVDPRHPQRPAADVEDSVESVVETFPVPRAFLQQELERRNQQIRIFSSQLQQAQEAKSKLVALFSSQKGGDGASGSGTAGRAGEDEHVQREKGEAQGAGGDVDQAGDSEDGRAAFERELQELYGDIHVGRARE